MDGAVPSSGLLLESWALEPRLQALRLEPRITTPFVMLRGTTHHSSHEALDGEFLTALGILTVDLSGDRQGADT